MGQLRGLIVLGAIRVIVFRHGVAISESGATIASPLRATTLCVTASLVRRHLYPPVRRSLASLCVRVYRVPHLKHARVHAVKIILKNDMSMGNPNNKKTGGSHALSITPHPEKVTIAGSR